MLNKASSLPYIYTEKLFRVCTFASISQKYFILLMHTELTMYIKLKEGRFHMTQVYESGKLSDASVGLRNINDGCLSLLVKCILYVWPRGCICACQFYFVGCGREYDNFYGCFHLDVPLKNEVKGSHLE